MISKEDIFRGTNNGLDILFDFFPQAKEVHGTTNNKFRARSTDKTPSAVLKEFDGIWKFIDFGDEGRAMNGIDVCMQQMDMKFSEAIHFLARKYNIQGSSITPELNKPRIESYPATEDEPDGYFDFMLKEDFTEKELTILGPKVKSEHCKTLGYRSAECIKRTKNGKTIITYSTDNYPIFIRTCRYKDAGGRKSQFYKIYQPLNPEKQYRFYYHGEKPQQYVNGLLELSEAYTRYNDEEEQIFRRNDNNKDREYIYKKLPEAVICSGERDALCVAALGYKPLWFNSESYNLSEKEFKEIKKYVEKVYNIPDIDETGVNRGMKLAFKHIDIHTVWLPKRLMDYRDRRGNPRKDFRDFCEIWPERNRFRGLLNMACPIKFWKEEIGTKGQLKLDIVTEYSIYYLRCSGFVTMDDKTSKTGYMFAHIDGNVVKEVKLKDLKAALKKFVQDRQEPLEIRELVNNSTRITETNLDLEEVELNFEDFTPKSQTFFFPNIIWEIKADKVIEHKPGSLNNYIWDEEVIKHNVTRLDSSFQITRKDGLLPSDSDNWDIKINSEHQSNFLRYLCNASRMFWRRELEDDSISEEELGKYKQKYRFTIDGPRLNETEIDEQKQHLINKIFCLGYLLHRYKAENKPWCVWAMDGKVSESDKSNGGSGKTFFMKAPMLFMKSEELPGRDPKATENKHMLENITEHTDYILVDDAHQYLDFDFFYEKITGALTINPKFNKSFTIPFVKSPKWGFTTNYTQRKFDDSTNRRMLYTVFSDYYHQKTANNDYKETRTIYDDFGKNLFREDYTDKEWNADINFFMDCVQFYLSIANEGVKIQPPMNNVISRNQLTIMGPKFFNWAEVYFSIESGNCDKFIPREIAKKDFENQESVKGWSSQKFGDALKAYCDYKFPQIIALNPEEYHTSEKRIIKKMFIPSENREKTVEAIYVKRSKLTDFVNHNTEDDDNNENTGDIHF